MHLTERTDFSLRVLLFLAVHEGERVAVRRMAEGLRVSETHLAKCVQVLAQHGFVRTSTGRKGGVELARPPQEIHIGAVVRALEAMPIVPCFTDESACPIVASCGLIRPLARARAAFLAALDEVTLTDATARRDALRIALAPP